MNFSIIQAESEKDYQDVIPLWQDFKILRGDGCFPIGGISLTEEIAQLPTPYNQEGNFILLVRNKNGDAVGCASVKKYGKNDAEVRRVFVSNTARGHGLGKRIMEQIIHKSRELGYDNLYLDSLKKFTHAHAIYEQLGFSYILPYDELTTEEMIDNMIFMKLAL